MYVQIVESHLGGRQDLILGGVRYSSFTEHDLRDIEFVLAQRRAMSRRCTAGNGEHTCGLDPGHTQPQAHLCRACTHAWQQGQEAEQ